MVLQISRRLATSRPFAVQTKGWEKKPVFVGIGQVRFSSISTETEVKIHDSEHLNGPLSTLPPKLTEVKREDSSSTFGHLFKTGKAYLTFYKDGLKAVLHNFKSSRPLLERQLKFGQGTLTKLVEDGLITRQEFQLVLRTRHDTRRIPIFLLVFALCGELTPFVVLSIPNIVPWTCRIPKQIEGQRKKQEARRAEAYENMPAHPAKALTSLKELDRKQLLFCSNVLGLHSTKWPAGFWLPPDWVLRRRIHRHTEYLNLDDILLERFGGPGMLFEGEELAMACTDRGIDVVGRPDKELREALERYLKTRKELGVGEGVVGAELFLTGRPDHARED